MTADYAAMGMERGMGMKKFLREFKEFAMRGNVLDMAVGVIIGGAFSKIVSSLVSDLIMPLLSIIHGTHQSFHAGMGHYPSGSRRFPHYGFIRCVPTDIAGFHSHCPMHLFGNQVYQPFS